MALPSKKSFVKKLIWSAVTNAELIGVNVRLVDPGTFSPRVATESKISDPCANPTPVVLPSIVKLA
jgi:hypothetical protein